jgi:hypothetical protein
MTDTFVRRAPDHVRGTHASDEVREMTLDGRH